MAIRRFLDCISHYSQKLSSKEKRFLYEETPPKNAKAEKVEAKKEPKDMNHEEFKKFLEEKTGIKIGRKETQKADDKQDRFTFKIDGLERSFLWNQKFEDTLKKLNDPEKIKQAVYKELARIVEKEGIDEVLNKLKGELRQLSGDTAQVLLGSLNKDMLEEQQKQLQAGILTKNSATGGPAEDKAPQPAESGDKTSDTPADGAIDKLKSKNPDRQARATLFDDKQVPTNAMLEYIQKLADTIKKGKPEEIAVITIHDDNSGDSQMRSVNAANKIKKILLGEDVPADKLIVFGVGTQIPDLKPGRETLGPHRIQVYLLNKDEVKDFKKPAPGKAPAPAPDASKGPGGREEKPVKIETTAFADFKIATTDAEKAKQVKQIAKIKELIQEDEGQLTTVRGTKMNEKNKEAIIKRIEKNLASLRATLARLEKGEVLTPDGEASLMKGSEKFVVDTRPPEEKATDRAPAPAPSPAAAPEAGIDTNEHARKISKAAEKVAAEAGTREPDKSKGETKDKKTDKDGDISEGIFDKDGNLIEGTLTVKNKDGIVIIKGKFEDEMLVEGTKTLPNKDIQKGKFKDGVLIEGTIVHSDGKEEVIAGETEKPAEAPKGEPEIPKEYLAKYNETRAKEKEIRAQAKETLIKAGADAKTIDPSVKTAIDAATQAADDAVKDLKGKTYKLNAHTNIIIGELKDKTNLLTKGRIIQRNGSITEGEFDKDTGYLIKGRIIYPDGYIYEGDFDKNTGYLIKGRVINPMGYIYEGNFDKGTLIKGRIILPDGTIKVVDKIKTPEIPAPSAIPSPIAAAPIPAPLAAPVAAKAAESKGKKGREAAEQAARLAERQPRSLDQWKDLFAQDKPVHKNVADLGEKGLFNPEGIEEKWKQIKGHGRVDKILTREPFNIDSTKTGRFITQVITQGSNKTVTFKDILKFAKTYNTTFPYKDYDDFIDKLDEEWDEKNVDEKNKMIGELKEMFHKIILPTLDLLQAITELEYKGGERPKDAEISEEERQQKIEQYNAEINIDKKLALRQELMRDDLYGMFQYSEREPGGWERMMAWFKGVENEVPVMTDATGEIKYLDKGILRRSYDPKAAFKIFLETRGIYTVDNNDNRKIDEKKMLAEINRLIFLGGKSIALQRLMFADKEHEKTPKELQREAKAHPEQLLQYVKGLEVRDLSKLTPDQLDAFQLGFIISQEMKEAKELQDIQEKLGDKNDTSPEGQKNQAMAAMVQNLQEQRVPSEDIVKIQDTLFAIGEVTFDTNGNLLSHGVALNKRIMLRPGVFLTIGGVKLEKGGTPIIALTAAYEGDNFSASATLELDLSGVSIGGSVAWENLSIGFGKRAKITIGAGARADFKNFELSLGAGAMITRRRVDIVAKENAAEMEQEAGLASRSWEAFKKSKGQPAEKRYAQLKDIPNLYNNVIEPFQTTFKATNEDIVYLMDSLKDEISNKGLDKVASSWTEFFHGVGLGLKLTTKPPFLYIGVFEFKIGSAKVYLPNRSEIGRMRDAISGRMVERKLELALAEIDKKIAAGQALTPETKPGEGKPAEGTAEVPKEVKTEFKNADTLPGAVSYGKDGMPKVHIKGANFSFATNLEEVKGKAPVEPKEPEAEKPPETEKDKIARFNKAVRGVTTGPDGKETYDKDQDAEVQLGEEKEGMREFKILNTYNKDVEVYIDPTLSLSDLGLVIKGGKLYITGDIDQIAISRERFFMPFQSQKSASNIKDVIVIRNQNSVRGGITRDWIEKYSGGYAEKLEGDSGFSFEKGYAKAPQANIKNETLTDAEEKEIQSIPDREIKKEQVRKDRIAKNAKTKADIAAEKQKVAERNAQIDKRAEEAKEMDKSTDRRHRVIGAIKQEDYEKQKLSDDYFSDMDKLSNDKKFQIELGKITDNDEAIKNLIISHSKDTDKKGNLKYPALKDIEKAGHESELDTAVILALNEWFKPLYKKGTEKDKLIHRILDRRIKFAQRVLKKSFEQAIASANTRLAKDKQINISAQDAAQQVIDKVYGNIKDKNFKFSELTWTGDKTDIEYIDKGSTLFSATRKKSDKKAEGTLTKTIAYKSLISSWGKMELDHGFIKAAMQEYDPNSKDENNKQIARLLLEMASPSPESDVNSSPEKAEKFLKSPLALKLASLETLMLIPELGKDKFDKISDLYEKISNPAEFAALLAKPGYKEALEAYRKIVQDVRDAETSGKPYEKTFKWGDDEYTLRLTMKTKIVAGAYARCANASFSVKEDGDVEIVKVQKPVKPGEYKYEEPEKPKEPARPMIVYMESTETLKSQQGKERVTAGVAVGVEPKEKPETPPEEKVHDKQAKQGAAAEESTDKQADQGASLPQPAQSGTQYNVPNENKGTQLPH